MTASALHDARESRMGLSNTAVVLVWMISSVKNDDQRSGQISSDPQLILDTICLCFNQQDCHRDS